MEPGARKPGSSALRIGVIGAGRIGSFHVRTLASLPGVASVTVCDADSARARRLAGELGLEVAATPGRARRRRGRRARDRDAHADARADDPAGRRRRAAGLLREAGRAGARRPGDRDRRRRAQRDPRADRLPAAIRRRLPRSCARRSPAAPLGRLLDRPGGDARSRRRRPSRTSRAPAASSATSTSTTSTRCASSRARRSWRSTPTAPCAKPRGSPTTATSTWPPPCSSSAAARLPSCPGRGTIHSATTSGSSSSEPATALSPA